MPAAAHGTVLADADVTVGNWDNDSRVFAANANPVNAVQVITRRGIAKASGSIGAGNRGDVVADRGYQLRYEPSFDR